MELNMDFFRKIFHVNWQAGNDNTSDYHLSQLETSLTKPDPTQNNSQDLLYDIDSLSVNNSTISLTVEDILGSIPSEILEMLSETFGIHRIDLSAIFFGKHDPAKHALAFSEAIWSQVEKFQPDGQYPTSTVTFYKKFLEMRFKRSDPVYLPFDPQIITSYTPAKPGKPATGTWKYEENYTLGEHYRSLINNPISDAIQAYHQVIDNPGTIEHEWFFHLLPNFIIRLEYIVNKLDRLYDDIRNGVITYGSNITIEYNCKFNKKTSHITPANTNFPIPQLNPDNYDLQSDAYKIIVDGNTSRWISAAIANIKLSKWFIERIRYLKTEIPRPNYVSNIWPFGS